MAKDKDDIQKVYSQEDVENSDYLSDLGETEPADIVIKISADTSGKNLNKFDIFWLKVWSFICSFIENLSKAINKLIKLIFRREAPLKYIKAVISTIVVVLCIAIVTAPFNITVNKVTTLSIFSNNLVAVQREILYSDRTPEYKWGYANKKGNVKIDCIYDDAMEFKHGVAFVNITETDSVTGASLNYWILINSKGKQQGDVRFYTTSNSAKPSVYNFSDETKLARVYVSGGKYGYINTKGKYAIDAQYDDAGDFINQIARVKLGDQTYYIKENGKKTSDYYSSGRDFCGELAAVEKNNVWGFINTKGDLVIDLKYDAVSDFNGDYAVVKLGISYGIIDKKGNRIVPTGVFTDLGVLKEFFPQGFNS